MLFFYLQAPHVHISAQRSLCYISLNLIVKYMYLLNVFKVPSNVNFWYLLYDFLVYIMWFSGNYYVTIWYLSCDFLVSIMWLVFIIWLSGIYHVTFGYLSCDFRIFIIWLSGIYHVTFWYLSCDFLVFIMWLSVNRSVDTEDISWWEKRKKKNTVKPV